MGRRSPCPRCGSFSYEKLKTHAHCPSCLFSPDIDDHFEPDLPTWAREYLPKESDVSLETALNERNPRVSLDLPRGVPDSAPPEEEMEP